MGRAAAATPRRRRRPRTGRTWCSLREAMLRRGASASMWTAAWRRRASTIWSRVIDAVTAAGGATDEARTDAVNLAQEVQDGQQIVIPSRVDDQAASSGAADRTASSSSQASGGLSPSGDDGLVNINTATAEELETLKGVGAATAEKIIADREANGPFKSIDDLTRVSGIGEKKLSAMRDRLCL